MAVEVPPVLSRDRIKSLEGSDQNRLKRQRRAYVKLQRRLNRAQNRGNKVQAARLGGLQTAIYQRAQDDRDEFRNERDMERQANQRERYLRTIAELQGLQQEQFDVTRANQLEQQRILREDAERRTALYEQILTEQREYQSLAEARTQREQALANFQQAQLRREASQTASLARGRVEAARSRRGDTPLRSLALG